VSEPTEALLNQERTLTVKGRGLVSADPDLVVLFFNVSGQDRSYAASVEKLNGRVESLRRDLETVNVGRAQLKTTDFRVRTDYDYTDRSSVFKGYVASHSLRLELPLDRDLLNRALAQVAQSASEATVNISFDVSDKESLHQRALRAAVENARESARVLADAAGVALGEITRIDYGFVEVRVRSRSVVYEMADASAAAPPPDIEPEALDAEENVTVVWAIT
jgi:uncharacterized protein YggE